VAPPSGEKLILFPSKQPKPEVKNIETVHFLNAHAK